MAVRRLYACVFMAGVMAAGAQGAGIRILTTLYPVHVIALNIVDGVPGVSLDCLSPPGGGCLHDYQLAPGDMVKLSRADVLIQSGLGAEYYIAGALGRFPGLKVIDAGAGIEPVVSGGETNAHVWLSVPLHIRQVKQVAAGLAAADPGNATRYRDNATAYAGRLEALEQRMRDGLKGAAEVPIVTFHDAFPYFAKAYGFVVAAVVEAHPGAEPNARELRNTIREIRRRGVRVVFAEPQYPAAPAALIAAETGAAVLLLDPVVTGELTVDAYIAAMDRNLDVLRKVLPADAGGVKEGQAAP